MQNTYQNSIYQKAKNYSVGVGLAALIFVTPKIAMGKTSEKYAPAKKEGITAVDKGNSAKGIGNVIGDYFEKAGSYPTLDELSREKKLNLGTGLEYTTLLPGSYVIGFTRPVGGALIDAPKEAMRRADAKRKSEKRLLKKAYQDKEEKGIAAILAFLLRGAWNSAGDVIELGRDISCFTENYIWVTGEGAVGYGAKTLEHAIKNPIDTGVKGVGTAVLIRWLCDAAHRTEHHVGVGGEEAPPLPPSFPEP